MLVLSKGCGRYVPRLDKDKYGQVWLMMTENEEEKEVDDAVLAAIMILVRSRSTECIYHLVLISIFIKRF